MWCFVPLCKNTTDDVSPSARKRISFHALPSDARLRAAWLKALGTQDGHLPDSAVVCSQHFLDDDIYETENGSQQICIGAIPSMVQVCMICLDTDSKLFLMSKHKLEEAYEKLIGHPVFDQGNLKNTLCAQCAQRLINFCRFRDKSLRSRALMMDLVEKHELITRKHIKMINSTENQLKSNFEVTMLGPDHCDLYILEDASEDKRTESFPSLCTTTLCNEATVVKNEEMYDSPAEEDMEMANKDANNADSISDEFVVSNEHLLSNTIMADTMDPLKYESLTLECTLCSEEFVGEHAYMQHMHMHGQNGAEDADCDTSQVCKPHTDPSLLTENKYVVQELNHGPSCTALDQQSCLAPLSAGLATNNECKVKAEEADTITKSIQLYGIFKIPEKTVPIKDEPLAKTRTAISARARQCRTDTAFKDFNCDMCNTTFKRKTLLVQHMKTHANKKTFTCKFCQFKYKCERSLKRHLLAHIDGRGTCHLCGIECAHNSEMVKHMRSHTGEKPYSCKLCEYKCTQNGALVRHVRTHTGEKPYSCELCEFKCTQKGSLVRHMRTHTGEKPYSCELCEYKCALKFHLVKHMRTHTGEKPYSCTLCEYKCTQKEHLVSHMRTHTGEKPYSCKLCEFKCSQKGSLVGHMRTHTNEKILL